MVCGGSAVGIRGDTVFEGACVRLRALSRRFGLVDARQRGHSELISFLLLLISWRGLSPCLCDKYANTPRKADFAWTVLARSLIRKRSRHHLDQSLRERWPPVRRGRRDKIWSEDDIAAVLSVASYEIRLALILALWSGQRQGDLLRLPWSAYESPYIRLRQSKGRRRVAMPAGTPLRAVLDSTERRGPLILTSPRPAVDIRRVSHVVVESL